MTRRQTRRADTSLCSVSQEQSIQQLPQSGRRIYTRGDSVKAGGLAEFLSLFGNYRGTNRGTERGEIRENSGGCDPRMRPCARERRKEIAPRR